MKKQITIILVLSFIFFRASAQKNSSFVPVDNLNLALMDKYAGTWEWKSGTSSFTLVLKKQQIATRLQILNGWYRYVKNGKTIIDKISKIDSIKYSGLSGYTVKGNDTVNMIFADDTRDKEKSGIIFFVNGDENKISIKFNKDENHPLKHLRFSPRKVYEDLIPENLNIILTRKFY